MMYLYLGFSRPNATWSLPWDYSAQYVVLASATHSQVSGMNTVRRSGSLNPSVYSLTYQSTVYSWGRTEGQKCCWINRLFAQGYMRGATVSLCSTRTSVKRERRLFFSLWIAGWGEKTVPMKQFQELKVLTDKYIESGVDTSHSINNKNIKVIKIKVKFKKKDSNAKIKF